MPEINKSAYQYVKWNNRSEKQIKSAERKKLKLENTGYTMVHQLCNSVTGDCILTYKLS